MTASAALALGLLGAAAAQQPAQPAPGSQRPEPLRPDAPELPPLRIVDAPDPAADVRAFVDFAYGRGDFRFRTPDVGSRTDAAPADYLRLDLELRRAAGQSLGLRLEAVDTTEDLRLDLPAVPFAARDAEGFVNLGVAATEGSLLLRLRGGVFARNLDLDNRSTGADSDWRSLGLRFEAKPEYCLVDEASLRWTVAGRLGFGFGTSWIDAQPELEDETANMTCVDFAVGTRLSVGSAQLEVGWLFRAQWIDASDDFGGTLVRAVETEFDGVTIGLTLRF